MATVSKESYLRLLSDRPYKFDAEEVDYKDAKRLAEYSFLQTDDARCGKCIHFYTRNIDGHNTCEIFRPADDSSVNPNFVCDFFSVDGEKLPVYQYDLEP